MKVKSESLVLQGLKAGVNRLDPMHPLYPTLALKHSAHQAGIGGEEKVADVFRKHSFPIDHRIFHDLALSSLGTFQIDTLFLTPSFALVLEVKNIAGHLRFEDHPPQLIRTLNGKTEGFDSPAAQVERNCLYLDIWLQSRKIHIPIYGVVVLAYSKQVVEKAPDKTTILFPNLIPSYIHTLSKQPTILSSDTFNWLSHELLNHHKDFVPAPLCEAYGISSGDIQTGVRCLVCSFIGMNKVLRNWHCPNCGAFDPIAHSQTIKEWFLLFGGKMTNDDCRKFLHIDKTQTAFRILQSSDLASEGSNRNKRYFMTF